MNCHRAYVNVRREVIAVCRFFWRILTYLLIHTFSSLKSTYIMFTCVYTGHVHLKQTVRMPLRLLPVFGKQKLVAVCDLSSFPDAINTMMNDGLVKWHIHITPLTLSNLNAISRSSIQHVTANWFLWHTFELQNVEKCSCSLISVSGSSLFS